MPIPRQATTGALLIGTALTAAGLNLGVMDLGTTPTVEIAAPLADGTQAPVTEQLTPVTAPTTSSEAPSETGTTIHEDRDDDAPPTSPSTSEAAPETTDPPATAPPTTATTVPEPTTTAATDPPTTQPAPVTEYVTFEFSGIADITVAVHDGERLEFWSVFPVEGMAFLVEDESSTKIKLKFRPKAGGEEAEWQVKLSDGDLEVKKEY